MLSMGTGLQNSIPKNDLTRPQSKQQQQKAKAVRTEYLKTFNHFIDTVTNTEGYESFHVLLNDEKKHFAWVVLRVRSFALE